MRLHKEVELENDLAHYDRARALFPADLIAWVPAT